MSDSDVLAAFAAGEGGGDCSSKRRSPKPSVLARIIAGLTNTAGGVLLLRDRRGRLRRRVRTWSRRRGSGELASASALLLIPALSRSWAPEQLQIERSKYWSSWSMRRSTMHRFSRKAWHTCGVGHGPSLPALATSYLVLVRTRSAPTCASSSTALPMRSSSKDG